MLGQNAVTDRTEQDPNHEQHEEVLNSQECQHSGGVHWSAWHEGVELCKHQLN